jgi:aryl-alcohol dehydrogenase-like predicted oxidoreductase
MKRCGSMADLSLGTVQFGMKYGVNNSKGQPSHEQSFEMLDLAIEKGIKVIDTARAYGEAELILGEYFSHRKNLNKVKVISKLLPNVIEEGERDITGAVKRELENSFRRLNVDYLNGYLLHTPEYIYNKDVLKALVKLKEEKLVQNIGVSIYEIEHGEEAIRTGIVDYIQLPYSILDQRGTKTGFMKRAKNAGITIFSRSAFLQGLFLMDHNKVPAHLQSAVIYMEQFEQLLQKYNINKIEALIHFVKQESQIDYFVFGVDNKEQLLEDIEVYHNTTIPHGFITDVKQLFNDIDKSIIFPSLWSNGKKVE